MASANRYDNPRGMGTNAATLRTTNTTIFSVSVENKSLDMRWLLLYRTPDYTDTPIVVPAYPDGGYTNLGSDFFTPFGLEFPNGVYWVFSTNDLVATPATGNDAIIHIRYV